MLYGMRYLLRILGISLLVPAAASAQSPSSPAPAPSAFRTLDTLPPRALPVLALRAKSTDRVAAQEAEWRLWATASPASPAPRLALAQLVRLDLRYDEGLAWADSAARLANVVVWRSAVARERLASRLVRGEFVGTEAMVRALVADTAGLPSGELAEVLYLQAAHLRRMTRRMTFGSIDTIASHMAPSDSSMRARLHCLRAVADPRRAVQHADTAIRLALAIGLPSIAANCELTVATLLVGAFDMIGADSWFDRADSTSRAAHDDPTLAATLQWRGYQQRTLGYVQRSRRWYTEAIRVSQRSNDRNVEAWALLGVATAARDVGDESAASSALARAATLFDATGDKLGALNARIERSRVRVQMRDLDGAELIALDAMREADSVSYVDASLRVRYVLSDVEFRRGRLAECAKYLDEAARYVERLGVPLRAQLQQYRGLLALRRGDARLASEILTTTRAAFARAQDLALYTLDGSLALAFLYAGDSVRSAEMLDESSRRLDAVRDTLAAAGLRKVIGSIDSWGGTEGNIDQAMAAFVTSPTWLPTVFTVTERTRARALLTGAFADESETSASEIRDARQRVRANSTVLSEVQRTLKENTALLIYAGGRGRARTSMMLVTRNSARGFTLAPLDSLDGDIVRWLALLESGESGVGAGRRVAQSVLGTALRTLPSGIRRLVVVPHGPLYRVPFQALPLGSGVLGDRVVVTVSPSVSLAMAYAVDQRSIPARVLAMGGGDTQVQSAVPSSLELTVERTSRSDPLIPLPSAGDEARAAAAWAPGSLALTGADASETALKRAARGGYTVLHAAAHALTSDQALGANYLILRADSVEDGYVSGGELASMSRGMSMIVLSGCRTTGDFGSRGDAIDGLVAPLLARGVRTVLASHWAVSDRWTKVLMERFYQRLAAGATTSDAMNDAQTSLRRSGVPARFWAAFSVIGDGALTFNPTTTTATPSR